MESFALLFIEKELMFDFFPRSFFSDDDDNVQETLGITPKPDATAEPKKLVDKLTNDEVHTFLYITAFLIFFLSWLLDNSREII